MTEEKTNDTKEEIGFIHLRHVGKTAKIHYLLRHVCPPIRPHGATRLPRK